ncbi:unnamed protein product [Hyaloperonospora brassicae]|uniref:RxLR effector candidate protein n=1 Tax=Hyaloperonospora brassicae TaxID=162125 RepID=A0AAV0SX02_HYABA|nr:unnamed protein product [Hyaloperonospora brassicae]
MRVITFALATTSILHPCTESVLEDAAPTATGLRGPTVVPALANGHDDTSFSRSLRSNVVIINVDEGPLVEGVVNRIESAVSSALVEHQQLERVSIEPFDGFLAMFPEHVADQTLLRRPEVTELLRLAHNMGLLKTPLSFKDEANVAEILADLLWSKDKKVQDFGKEYLEVLILRWAKVKMDPADVSKELGVPKRSLEVFFDGDSAADVVLKKYCARAKPEEPDLYYKLISEVYGGPRRLLAAASMTFVRQKFHGRSLKIMKAAMRLGGVDNSKQKELLEHFERMRQMFEGKLEDIITHKRSPDQVKQFGKDAIEGMNSLLSLVDEMFESGGPVMRFAVPQM